MLYLYIGQPRNGKTISLITEAQKFYLAGYSIYSNIKLKFPYTPLTRQMILEWEKVNLDLPPKTIFAITEIGSWFDSRNSAHSNNKVFSYFITQLGHFTEDKQRGLTILGDTQTFGQIDIRARRTVYRVIECRKYAELKNEWVKILRTYKANNNLVLKTVKQEKVMFNKEDFDLYDTQDLTVKSNTETKPPTKKELKLIELYYKEQGGNFDDNP